MKLCVLTECLTTYIEAHAICNFDPGLIGAASCVKSPLVFTIETLNVLIYSYEILPVIALLLSLYVEHANYAKILGLCCRSMHSSRVCTARLLAVWTCASILGWGLGVGVGNIHPGEVHSHDIVGRLTIHLWTE